MYAIFLYFITVGDTRTEATAESFPFFDCFLFSSGNWVAEFQLTISSMAGCLFILRRFIELAVNGDVLPFAYFFLTIGSLIFAN
jgi:hypothetical protein